MGMRRSIAFSATVPLSGSNTMARSNYSAGKRQRELDKARKKKEKAAQKLERRSENAAAAPKPEEPPATTED